MTIYFGADHAGFAMKEALVPFVRELGYEAVDMGAKDLDATDDYPDFVVPVAKQVAVDPVNARGIVVGGSGQGEAIAANRVHGVRAVVFNGQYEPKDGRQVPHEIEVARQHNDSNVLSLGARFLNLDEAKEAVKLWLSTPYAGEERHARRLKKIEDMTAGGPNA